MLTKKQIAALKPKKDRYVQRVDSHLYVEVHPSGRKTWLFRKMRNRKVIKKGLGSVGELSLYEARQKRDKLLSQFDALSVRSGLAQEPSFSEVAEEWMRNKCERDTSKKNSKMQRSRLDRLVLPILGGLSCREISGQLVLQQVLRPIESRGENSLAHSVATLISMILRYGVASGYADRDVIPDLRGALASIEVEHYAWLKTPEEIGKLLRRLDALEDSSTKLAMTLCAYTFVRPSEARCAKWSEFDLDKAVWQIPPERMKKRRKHVVPLSTQVVELLKKAQIYAAGSDYVFPSPYKPEKCIGPSSYQALLRRIGYGASDMTTHGFRSIACTILNENGWLSDVIELQLSHVESNKVRASYNHSEHLSERTSLMQWYADYLDSLRSPIVMEKAA